MSTALQVIRTAQAPALDRPIRPLPIPWRDPHTVLPAELKEYIEFLEKACEEHPLSADLRTCLGVAHAMNYDVYKSMDALEGAVGLDETHFFAQLKYSELLYRLRGLERAEAATTDPGHDAIPARCTAPKARTCSRWALLARAMPLSGRRTW